MNFTELTMSQAHSNNGPQNLHSERALLDHTRLLVNAISASGPGPRPPAAAPQHSSADWRDYLRTLGETIIGYLTRRETNRIVRRIRAGELERGDIDAWAARATANSGFGGVEATNDGNYVSAA